MMVNKSHVWLVTKGPGGNLIYSFMVNGIKLFTVCVCVCVFVNMFPYILGLLIMHIHYTTQRQIETWSMSGIIQHNGKHMYMHTCIHCLGCYLLLCSLAQPIQ